MKNNNSKLKRDVKTYVWQANIEELISKIKRVPNSSLTPKYQQLKGCLLNVFVHNNDTRRFKAKDQFVRDLLEVYKKYWKLALLKEAAQKKAENYLSHEIETLLKNYSINFKKSKGINYLEKMVSKELTKRGFYHILGVVQPLRELEIWKRERKKIYTVELFKKTKQKVTVVFMEEFVTNGWADYASCGITFPGGWAKKDALYCVKKRYSVNSESFNVTYLVHEAQHFSDYKKFPKLKQIDLEYRAKLAEIYSSKRLLYTLIENFTAEESTDLSIPHSYASNKIIADLSKKVFNINYLQKDSKKWRKVDKLSIKSAALNLYNEHTEKLLAIGAKKVTGVL
ncbi:MAG: hypothetical protein ISR65_20770 [Bacteriovoracaceae bacterium]|nr:hypothetical protein [Bacteriovoracaceae bacterium]